MIEGDIQVNTPPDDTVIWRYIDLEKVLALASSGTLYLPRVDRFHDPWECAWPNSVVEALRASVEAMRIQHPNVPDISTRALVEYARQTFFVSCWHASSVESAALWYQYSRTAGIAIRTTVGRLKKSLRTEFRGFLGLVTYIDFANENIDLIHGGVIASVFWKRQSFRHENEVRLALWNVPSDNPPWPSDAIGIPLEVDLATLMEHVFISPTSSPWLVDPIRRMFESFGHSSVPVDRSTLYDPMVY